jgi:hypothetical protein
MDGIDEEAFIAARQRMLYFFSAVFYGSKTLGPQLTCRLDVKRVLPSSSVAIAVYDEDIEACGYGGQAITNFADGTVATAEMAARQKAQDEVRFLLGRRRRVIPPGG